MIIINIYQLLKFYLANSRLGHIVFRKQSYINNDRNNNPSKMQHFYQQKHKKKNEITDKRYQQKTIQLIKTTHQ